jgi:NADPH-dependent ferric siderophore reductase
VVRTSGLGGGDRQVILLRTLSSLFRLPAPPRPLRRTIVETVEQLTPHMVRIAVGGEGLADFEAGAFSDHYVKLQLPPAGADYDSGADFEAIRATRSRDEHPLTRTYSVRSWNQAERRLTIDFVVHGDSGVAGPWAAAAEPGDVLQFQGPGGAYSPRVDADWHLLAGDASVLPAIGASLERMPAGVAVFVVAEVDGPEEELALPTAADLRLRWLHRSESPGEEPDLLTEAVRALHLPAGDGHAFVHGEASSARALRRHFLVERELPAARLSASGYWKLRRTEEGWREDKAEWNRLAAADAPA